MKVTTFKAGTDTVLQQVFGWTARLQVPEQFKRYILAFEAGDNIRLEIRNGAGVSNEILLPRADAADLASTLVCPFDEPKGTKPLIIYFADDHERNCMIEACHQSRPGMVARKL